MQSKIQNPKSKILLLAALLPLLASAARADEESPRLLAYHERIDRAVDNGLRFLATRQVNKLQAEDSKEPFLAGSFRGFEPGNTGLTSLCVMAFLSKGYTPGHGRYGQVIDHGIDYVLDQQHDNGLLYAKQRPGVWNGLMYCHSIATLLLGEASGMVDSSRQKKIDEALPKALALLLNAQQMLKGREHSGGWRYNPASNDSDLSLTGWSIMALRAGRLNGVPVPKQNIQQAVEYIKKCRVEQDGGFAYQPHQGSTVGLTGCAVLCLELCGAHGDKVVPPAGDYILAHLPDHHDGGMKSTYAYYYCSQATFQLGSRYWETWAPRMYDLLLASQQPNGSWNGENGDTYCTPMSILAMTVSYRQLPIYQRDDSYEEATEKP
jgi:hypothetical protein